MSKPNRLSPPASTDEAKAPANVDAILQSILGMAAAVLRGGRILAQVWKTRQAVGALIGAFAPKGE